MKSAANLTSANGASATSPRAPKYEYECTFILILRELLITGLKYSQVNIGETNEHYVYLYLILILRELLIRLVF